MNNNYQKARELMVKNQLRPNRIKDKKILNIFENIPKEDFLLSEIKDMPYSDLDINIYNNRGYLKNLHIAQLISSAEIKKNHKVMHLGALTGYVTSIISKLCLEIVAIEIVEKLNIRLQKNIKEMELSNVKINEGSFEEGCEKDAPYDRIIIDNPIEKLNNIILNQLSEDSGKIIMIQKENNNLCKAIKITKNNKSFNKEFLFDVFTKYQLFEINKGFSF